MVIYTTKDLQSFLGLEKYLNRFSANLAHIAEPLQRLCKKDTVYAWESQQQEAFEAIKIVILTAPVLAYFDKDKKHYIQTDASLKGLGTVLLRDGHSVVYASRSLIQAEKQYSSIERELLAVVFAMEGLHHCVYGYTVTVEADHKSLVLIWCKTIATTSLRLQHLLLRLAQYYLDIVYHGWPKVHSDCHLLLLDYWNFRDEISLEDSVLCTIPFPVIVL